MPFEDLSVFHDLASYSEKSFHVTCCAAKSGVSFNLPKLHSVCIEGVTRICRTMNRGYEMLLKID